jgi:hypothetical protein
LFDAAGVVWLILSSGEISPAGENEIC